MNKQLLKYYNDELAYLRKAGRVFAKIFPKVAGKIAFDGEQSSDPHMERLLESFALLTSRLHMKVDDELPELIDSLLNLVYPHYLLPFPACAIVQVVPSSDLAEPYELQRKTKLKINNASKECLFTSCASLKLYPIAISQVKYELQPIHLSSAQVAGIKSLISIKFNTFNPDVDLTKIGPNKLRLFVDTDKQSSQTILDLLANNIIDIKLEKCDDKNNFHSLGKQVLSFCGADRCEAVFPPKNNSFEGYRILCEYLYFPEKFQFFEIDVSSLGNILNSQSFTIHLCFSEAFSELQTIVDTSTFLLNCVPIVNLHEMVAEPISIYNECYEYKVVPDVRSQDTFEIYSVDSVSAITSEGRSIECRPFYHYGNLFEQSDEKSYWYSSRRSNVESESQYSGSTTFISFDDNSALVNSIGSEFTLSINATCTATAAVQNELFKGALTEFSLVGVSAPVANISAVSGIRKPYASNEGGMNKWKLVAHMANNFASLSGDKDTSSLIKEMFKLYIHRDDIENASLIDAIVSLQPSRAVKKVKLGSGISMLCGTKFILTLDMTKMLGSSTYLFSKVIYEFLRLYTSINSFVELEVCYKDIQKTQMKFEPSEGVRWCV